MRAGRLDTCGKRLCTSGDLVVTGVSWAFPAQDRAHLDVTRGVRSDHSERALGHVQGAVERAYDKHDYVVEKRAAFEALAAEVDRIIGQQSEANVLQLNAA